MDSTIFEFAQITFEKAKTMLKFQNQFTNLKINLKIQTVTIVKSKLIHYIDRN